MFIIDQLILLAAILIAFGILSSKVSARLGLPVLVMFLIVGMLAGEDGPGGIDFDNALIAHSLGTLALAIILFDGGLNTPMASIKSVWKPASLLATLGVLFTSAITGLAAAYILDIPLIYGLLIGAIVGSTDAAAVFSLLRNAGIHINPKLKSTLEIESATNDPMAILTHRWTFRGSRKWIRAGNRLTYALHPTNRHRLCYRSCMWVVICSIN